MYQPLDPQHACTYRMRALPCDREAPPVKKHSAHSAKMQAAIEKLLAERMQEKLSLCRHRQAVLAGGPGRAAASAGGAARKCARHPCHARNSPGPRASFAAPSPAKRLPRQASVALAHRIRLAQGDDICMESLLKSIFSSAIFGIPLPKMKSALPSSAVP